MSNAFQNYKVALNTDKIPAGKSFLKGLHKYKKQFSLKMKRLHLMIEAR